MVFAPYPPLFESPGLWSLTVGLAEFRSGNVLISPRCAKDGVTRAALCFPARPFYGPMSASGSSICGSSLFSPDVWLACSDDGFECSGRAAGPL